MRYSPWRDSSGEIIGVITTVSDVTERRRAEQEQSRQAEQYRAILTNIQDGYYEFDLAGNLTFCNEALGRIYGYSQDEIIGASYRRFAVTPAITAQAYQVFNEVYRTGVPLQGWEYETVRRDGTSIFVEVSVSLLKDEGDQVIGFQGIVRDVTARKRLEVERDRVTESLRAREARFRAMIEKSAEGIALMTAEGHLTYTSPAFTRLLGYTASETLGQSVINHIHPEDAPGLISQIGALQNQPNQTLQVVYRAQHQDGSWRWLEANITNLLHDPDVQALVVNFRDITERLRTEEQLQLLGTAVKQAGESILITTANLDQPGPEIVFVNPAFTKITGYTLKEVLGKTPRLLQGPGTDRATLDRLRTLLAKGERFTGETINYRKDGTEFYLEWDAAPMFNSAGEITHYIAVQRDITARKQFEQTLLESERRFRAVFGNAQDAILIFDDEMQIVDANAAACELYGYKRSELLACRLWNFTTFDSVTAVRQAFQELLRDGQQQGAMPILRADGTRREIEYNATADFLPGRHLSICRDVTARKRAETLVRGQVKVLRLIAAGAPLARTLDTIARLVEKLASGVRCSILLLDEDGLHLRHGAAPRLPAEYNQQIDGLAIGPNVGSCGAAAFKGKPVICTDISQDPLWANYREMALQHGLRACWSTPILTTTRQVLGTFALYYREPRAPHGAELKLVESLTHLAGIAIARQRSEQALRQSEERYRELFEQAPIGIYRTTPDGRILLANPTMLQMLGFSSFAELASHNLEQEGWGFHIPRQRFRELIEAQGEIKGLEVVWRRRTNELINVRENAVLKRDKQGQVVYYEGTVEDITIRKQAEEALRASENRYRSLVAGLDEGVILQDEHGQIVACNASAERILGLRAEQLLGCTLCEPRWRAIHEDGTPFPGAEHPVMVALRTGRACSNVRMGVYKPDDTLRWISINAQPLFHADAGQPYAAVVSFTDITERKQAEEELRASETRFATAFNSSPCPMAILTFPEGRFVNVNEVWQRDYGFSPDEVIGRTSAELNHWVMSQQRSELYERLQTQGSVRNLEVLLRTKQDNIRNTIISAEIIEVGGLKYVLSSSNDITDRKRAEDALRDSETRYRLLFERNLAGVYRSTTNGQLLEANDALARIFGYQSRAEILQVDMRTLYIKRRERVQLMDTLRRDGRLNNVELLLRRRDGSTVWTLSNITLFPGADGQPDLLEGVVLDISELKKVEAALAQSHEELRALSARLEAVREEERIHIAREIHDNLGQLLTGLKLEFSWLDKRIQQATDEVLRKRVGPKMVEVAALLEETIQTVRDIATELRPGILDTLGLRAALEWQAREFQKRTGVKCGMDLGQVPPTLSPERTTMLFRIFQEILTNVARHAQARYVQVRLAEGPSELRLSVHDDGVGISAAQRDHPKSLGLIGMRERALMFGGSLSIDGKPGRGTTVEVRVPLNC
jgi:PAS domain S-box-containing protein